MTEERKMLPIKVNLGALHKLLCPECQKKIHSKGLTVFRK